MGVYGQVFKRAFKSVKKKRVGGEIPACVFPSVGKKPPGFKETQGNHNAPRQIILGEPSMRSTGHCKYLDD